jgi:hypothetical protein
LLLLPLSQVGAIVDDVQPSSIARPAMVEAAIAVVDELVASGSGTGRFSPVAYDGRLWRPSGLQGCRATAPVCFV